MNAQEIVQFHRDNAVKTNVPFSAGAFPAPLFAGENVVAGGAGVAAPRVLVALYPVQSRTHYAAEFEDTLACLGGNGGGGVLLE